MNATTFVRIGAVGVLLIGVGLCAFAILGYLAWREFHQSFSRHEVPQQSAADASAIVLDDKGTTLTIKQRQNAWLPGGSHKLHLDDISGGQVLVSVTDSSGNVFIGPTSLREGDRLKVTGSRSTLEIELTTLRNLLVGDDFAEIHVRPIKDVQGKEKDSYSTSRNTRKPTPRL